MVAKAEWFSRRRYTGWGLTPKSWQGWVYVGACMAVIVGIQSLPIVAAGRLILTLVAVVLVMVDIMMAMLQIKMDEREIKIEAIAERNAAWVIVFSTALSIIYVATWGREIKGLELLPTLIVPMLLGVAAKAITNFILDKKGV